MPLNVDFALAFRIPVGHAGSINPGQQNSWDFEALLELRIDVRRPLLFQLRFLPRGRRCPVNRSAAWLKMTYAATPPSQLGYSVVERLWALTEAHLTLHGAAGAHVSSHTLAAYR